MPKAGKKSPKLKKHITPGEFTALHKAARNRGRNGHRDATMLLLAYRHGLRCAELVSLEWSQVDLQAGHLHVARRKAGTPSTHPLQGDELRALRRLESVGSRYVFTSELDAPMTTSNVRKLLARICEESGLPHVNAHALRHGAGYALAAEGQDTRALQLYLGHRNIRHTETYTALSPARFKSFWRSARSH